MQILPANNTSEKTSDLFSAPGGFDNNNEFSGMLSSFIEDDRLDYSGRPPGFAAYGADTGTIDQETTTEIAKELRKRKVSEENVARLEALAASGSAVTIGSIAKALRGDLRFTEGLEEGERDTFKQVMGKLGFNKTEQDELLDLSDSADIKTLLSRITGKLQELGGTVDLDRKEFSALLKGLDASDNTKNPLLDFFKNGDTRSLSAKDMDQLLSNVRAEQGARAIAASHAMAEMRDAINSALDKAKNRKQTATVENTRGSRLTEQREALMQNSTRKNTGVDKLQSPETEAKGFGKQFGGSDDFSDAMEDRPRSRSERILETRTALMEAKGFSASADKPRQTESSSLRNVTAAAVFQPSTPVQQPVAHSLNSMVKGYRQEIFSQVEQGILSGVQNGAQRLTLQLNPNDLGQVTVALSMYQGELKATIRAEQPEAAGLLKEQMAEIKAALEAEGIRVKELDVQTGLRDDHGAQWDGTDGHNMLRDAEERNRMLRLSTIRREAAGRSGQEEHLETTAQNVETTGLHVVA